MAKLTIAPAAQATGTSKIKPSVPKTSKASVFSDSDDLALERYRLTTHGGSGHGKTFFAASASDHWPSDLPSKKKVVLKDMLWIAFDAGAVVGFREQGISIPNVIDVRKLMTPAKEGETRVYARTILDALAIVVREASARVAHGGINWVVCDTISSLDKALNAYWESNCPTTKAGVPDKFAMYRAIGINHQRFHEAMQLMDTNVHFLCHTKARIEADPNEKSQKNRQKAAETPGDNELIPDITGQSLNTYTANVSAEFALLAKKQLGTKVMKRYVHPIGHQGYRGKNRWQHSLEEEEVADLGKILKKIEAHH